MINLLYYQVLSLPQSDSPTQNSQTNPQQEISKSYQTNNFQAPKLLPINQRSINNNNYNNNFLKLQESQYLIQKQIIDTKQCLKRTKFLREQDKNIKRKQNKTLRNKTKSPKNKLRRLVFILMKILQ